MVQHFVSLGKAGVVDQNINLGLGYLIAEGAEFGPLGQVTFDPRELSTEAFNNAFQLIPSFTLLRADRNNVGTLPGQAAGDP